MTFVSYAQNFEDVMLWRALKHIENGVYVDVGAQNPIIDSVSKAFYEHGWRGIHFEPVPYYADLLRQDRPDEVVLEVALSDVEGTLEFNVIAKTGLSTAVNNYAQRHYSDQGFESQKIQVPTLTLTSALRSIEDKDVHWLKIDVEGLEEKVLKGWDSQVLRPWIMVIEATIPASPEVNYANWEPMLIAADYQFVYFDGLNRFYVAKEHSELVEAFSCPPNVFDGFELSGLASSQLCRGLIESHKACESELVAEQQKAENLFAQLSQANEQNSQLHLQGDRCKSNALWLQNEWDAAKVKIDELNHSSHHWWTVADGLNQENKTLYTSRSWRITKPLRLLSLGVSYLIKGLLAIPKGIWWVIKSLIHTLLLIPKAIWWLFKWPFKLMLSGLIRYAIKRPAIKLRLFTWLRKYPKAYAHTLQFARVRGINVDAMPSTITTTQQPQITETQKFTMPVSEESTTDLTSLSPRARRIYLDLKETMDSNNKENS